MKNYYLCVRIRAPSGKCEKSPLVTNTRLNWFPYFAHKPVIIWLSEGVYFQHRKVSYCLREVIYCLREESVCMGSSKLSACGQVLPYRWLGREQKNDLILLLFPDSSIFWALLWRKTIFKGISPYYHRNYAFSVGFKQNFAWNMLFQHALGESPYIIGAKRSA